MENAKKEKDKERKLHKKVDLEKRMQEEEALRRLAGLGDNSTQQQRLRWS